MRKRELAAIVAMSGAFAYTYWYELIQCPGCRAEREAEGGRRQRERHEKRHRQ